MVMGRSRISHFVIMKFSFLFICLFSQSLCFITGTGYSTIEDVRDAASKSDLSAFQGNIVRLPDDVYNSSSKELKDLVAKAIGQASKTGADEKLLRRLLDQEITLAAINNDLQIFRKHILANLVPQGAYAEVCKSVKGARNRFVLAQTIIDAQNWSLLGVFLLDGELTDSCASMIMSKLCSLPDDDFTENLSKAVAEILINTRDLLSEARRDDYKCFKKVGKLRYTDAFSVYSKIMKSARREGLAVDSDLVATIEAAEMFYEPLRAYLRPLLRSSHPSADFEVGEKMGEGGNGRVFSIKMRGTGTEKALKIVKLKPYKTMKSQAKEITIHMDIPHHENILEIQAVYQVGNELFIVLPLMSGGSLASTLNPRNLSLIKEARVCKLGEPEIALVARQILSGLAHMHKNGFIHRDLKLDNVLWDKEGTIKIADFGHSIRLRLDQEVPAGNHWFGTSYWRAPELVGGTEYDSSVDIWAFGICLAEILRGGDPPHSRIRSQSAIDEAIFEKGTPKMSYLSKFSPKLQDFVKKCLAVDKDKRATAAELLKHPFLRKYKNKSSARDKRKLAKRLEVVKKELLVKSERKAT